MPAAAALDANIARFSGFAGRYDAHRPQPPLVIPEILSQLARVEVPRLVVDLGCGTGLSTRIWAGRADEVIGIEPNDDMRRRAEARAQAETLPAAVRYLPGSSSATGLPDRCADVVTCSQSLHWMEPEPTFAEVARILRPGGVFAAYDCDWPPAMDWEVELAYREFMQRVRATEMERRASPGAHRWPKHEHLDRIQASGHFRYVREILAHSPESGDAERVVGLALSQSSVAALLGAGLSEAEIGLERLREVAGARIGSSSIPWYFSYRIRIGIR
jgi:SAM-dependent methyltransferase